MRSEFIRSKLSMFSAHVSGGDGVRAALTVIGGHLAEVGLALAVALDVGPSRGLVVVLPLDGADQGSLTVCNATARVTGLDSSHYWTLAIW